MPSKYYMGMTLKEYIQKEGLTIKELSERLGYSRTHLSLVISGISNPSDHLKKHIYLYTKGEVQL